MKKNSLIDGSSSLVKRKTYLQCFLSIFLLVHCKTTDTSVKKNDALEVDRKFMYVENQYNFILSKAEKTNAIPRTVDNDKILWIGEKFDWTSGFFPGSCWYIYEATNDAKWKRAAEKFQSKFEHHKFMTSNHDLGFVFNSSYGNGFRLTQEESFKETMIIAGNSLIQRFNPKVGAIQSWDVDKGWQSKRGWEFPVIIDNMMNLELLFELSRLTGDPKYKNIAIIHANTTLKNHFREDYSSYHVIDYDSETGKVRNHDTAQGYSKDSAWSRGQAWGLYGFTVCYRYTKDKKYLVQAEQIANFILAFKETPQDGIPFWDYHAPKIPNEPRDVSAAAITASALIELDGYTNKDYMASINNILMTLSSNSYLATIGSNNGFLLKHSVGSIPHGNEIDVPLNYADYYFVEALLRMKKSSTVTRSK